MPVRDLLQRAAAPVWLAAIVAFLALTARDAVPRSIQTTPLSNSTPLGSSPVRAAALREIEQRFLNGVSTESISALHRQVTEHPHIAGSARSMEVADRLRRALDTAGLQTEVREFLVHLSTPRSVLVEIVSPIAGSLMVREPASPHDPDGAHPELGPAFVAYSASGIVTACFITTDYSRGGVCVSGKLTALVNYSG